MSAGERFTAFYIYTQTHVTPWQGPPSPNPRGQETSDRDASNEFPCIGLGNAAYSASLSFHPNAMQSSTAPQSQNPVLALYKAVAEIPLPETSGEARLLQHAISGSSLVDCTLRHEGPRPVDRLQRRGGDDRKGTLSLYGSPRRQFTNRQTGPSDPCSWQNRLMMPPSNESSQTAQAHVQYDCDSLDICNEPATSQQRANNEPTTSQQRANNEPTTSPILLPSKVLAHRHHFVKGVFNPTLYLSATQATLRHHYPYQISSSIPLGMDGLVVSEAGSSSSSYRTGSSRAVQDSFGPEADVPTLVETFQDGQSIVLANAWLTLSNSLERCSGTPQTPPRSSSRRSFLHMNALISILARGHFV
ncbi:hypothetical protein M422DRAFT_243724 [Sphaerobolus stellatus SS14]|nr:hypothetical protein M422DRAFT_243724 [Sphaerobolus stellatus SS14]